MTNPGEPEEEQAPRTYVEEVTRNVIAGHPRGAVRRIILYIITGVSALLAIAVGGPLGLALGSVSLVTLLLLGFTDDLA